MKSLTTIFLLLITFLTNAQETFIGGTAHYMYQIPLGNIASQYGSNSNAGFNLNIKLANNITLGMEGQFMFGSQYNDMSVLGTLVTTNGFIIGENNIIEIPALEGRGGNFFAEMGKIFPLNKKNKNSGLHIKGGIGYIFYSVFTDADVQSITQLRGDYANGYNRLESGWGINSFFGYTLYSKNKMINGSIGLQAIFSSTKFQGVYDYATSAPPSQSSRSTIFIGPKLGVTVVFKRFIKQDPNSDGYFYN
jgi:hypothetical protein